MVLVRRLAGGVADIVVPVITATNEQLYLMLQFNNAHRGFFIFFLHVILHLLYDYLFTIINIQSLR